MRNPYDFQRDGAAFLESPQGHMLAADAGLGKTHQTMRTIYGTTAMATLVVCPPIVVNKWIREAELDLPHLHSVEAHKDIAAARVANIVSVSGSNLEKFMDLIKARRWDLIVVDEAQNFRNQEAQRTRLLYNSGIKTEKFIQLSGTPTPKHAGNLWTHITATDPKLIDNMTYEEFTNYYCVRRLKRIGGEMMMTVDGNYKPHIPELRQRLSGWWKRQRKGDLLPQLPPKTFETIYLPAKKVDLERIKGEFDPELLEQVEYALWVAAETGNFRELELLEDAVSRLRRMIAIVKAEATAEYADFVLQCGEPCAVLWSMHTEPIKIMAESLRKRGRKVGVITGATSKAADVKTVDAFMAGNLDVVVAQIIAGGTGIDLFRARRAIFLDESFLPSDNEQAQDRVHRIGQIDPVQIDRVVLEGSIDEAVRHIVERRQNEWEDLQCEA